MLSGAEMLPRRRGSASDARVDLAGGAIAEAEVQLQSVAAGTSPDAAEALALLIEERLSRGQPVDAATAAHAEAMAFERAGSPVAGRLTRGNARALASLGDFDAAMAAFARMDRPSQDEVMPDLLAELTRAAPDTAFLIHVFALRDRLDIALSPALRLALSDRLLDLGFPTEARLLLAAATPGPEAALQRARAALLREDPRAALREIAGRTDAEAESVRAAAYLTLGQPMQAAEAYLAAGREDQAASAAWRAGDLAMAGRLAEAERGAAIGALAAPPADAGAVDGEAPETASVGDGPEADSAPIDDPAEADAPLANARALLERSVQTRAAIDALLATFPAP
jgi:tetratricopeptide (TPR) repeat protein